MARPTDDVDDVKLLKEDDPAKWDGGDDEAEAWISSFQEDPPPTGNRESVVNDLPQEEPPE